MKDPRRHIRWLIIPPILSVLLVSAASTFAAPDKCQLGLEKAAGGFASDVKKSLSQCADAVTKAQLKGTAVAKAAATCEKALQGVYDVGGSKGSSSVTRFRMACSSLTASGKCTASDLTLGNYLLSGLDGEAPPATGDIGKFTCDWLLLATEKLAIEEEFFAVPKMLDLLRVAATAPESQAGKGDGTSCTDPAARGYRPNLCRFGIECHQVACQLDTGELFAGAGPGTGRPVTGRIVLDECKAGTAAGVAFGVEPTFLYLAAAPSRALLTATFPSPPDTVCVDVLRGQGWCDCSQIGAGIHLDPNLCQDRIAEGNNGTDDCGVSVSLATTDPNFPGTKVGRAVRSSTGASTSGDCLMVLTVTTKALPPANFGPDGVACTDDDLTPWGAPGLLSFTTGTAQVALKDAVQTAGGCSGNAGATACIEDANCATANGGPGGTCSAPAPTLVTSAVAPVTGSAGNCASYQAGDLSKLVFVGNSTVVLADGAFAVGVRLTCQ